MDTSQNRRRFNGPPHTGQGLSVSPYSSQVPDTSSGSTPTQRTSFEFRDSPGDNNFNSSTGLQNSAPSNASFSGFSSLTELDDDTEMKRNSGVSFESEEFDFKRGELIGKGSFGRVYCALNNRTGEMIAIKQIDMDMMSEEDRISTMGQLEAEIQLMRQLRHNNIVALLGSQIQHAPKMRMNIIMEYVPGNSIEKMLKQFGPFSENVIINYTRQLLHALSYCHGSGVIHRDIKGKNVLLHTSGVLKLADFGSAKMLNDVFLKDAPSIHFSYTPLWIAPEVLVGDYNARVDIWSLGCVIVEMATALPPWSECNIDNPYRAMYHIANSDQTPKIPERLSPLGKHFLSLCFQRDPDKRPSADELLQHPWVGENQSGNGNNNNNNNNNNGGGTRFN